MSPTPPAPAEQAAQWLKEAERLTAVYGEACLWMPHDNGRIDRAQAALFAHLRAVPVVAPAEPAAFLVTGLPSGEPGLCFPDETHGWEETGILQPLYLASPVSQGEQPKGSVDSSSVMQQALKDLADAVFNAGLTADLTKPWLAAKRALALSQRVAPSDEITELRAQVARLTIRTEAYENAYRIAYQATFQSHTGHWDKTGQHGAGCPECIRAREARENCDTALRDGLGKLTARALLAEAVHPSPAPQAALSAAPAEGVRLLTAAEQAAALLGTYKDQL